MSQKDTKRKLEKAIRSIFLKVKKRNGKVVTYCRHMKRRFSPLMQVRPKGNLSIKVVYADGSVNESAWYKTKKELKHAYRCFTEQSLLEEFLPIIN